MDTVAVEVKEVGDEKQLVFRGSREQPVEPPARARRQQRRRRDAASHRRLTRPPFEGSIQ